jgi:hypothetical protein
MAGCSAEHWDFDSAVQLEPPSVAMKVDLLVDTSVATMAGRWAERWDFDLAVTTVDASVASKAGHWAGT